MVGSNGFMHQMRHGWQSKLQWGGNWKSPAVRQAVQETMISSRPVVLAFCLRVYGSAPERTLVRWEGRWNKHV